MSTDTTCLIVAGSPLVVYLLLVAELATRGRGWRASEDVRTAPLADSGDLNDQLSTTDSGEAARGTE